MLNAISWRLNTGAPWRDLPQRYGPWQTVYDRFRKLRPSGLLDRIIGRLQLRLNEAGLIDPELCMATASWCRLLAHLIRAAASRIFCTAGKSRPMRMAMWR